MAQIMYYLALVDTSKLPVPPDLGSTRRDFGSQKRRKTQNHKTRRLPEHIQLVCQEGGGIVL